MKTRLALVALLVATGCDSEPASEDKAAPKVEVPTKKEIKGEIDRNVKDVLSDKGPKWKVVYTGDLNGSIEGGIMTALKIGMNTTVAGAGMTKDKKDKAKEALQATISGPPGKQTAMVTLTLADGTQCGVTAESAKQPAELKISEPDPKKLRAELKGALGCGEKKDKLITYTATLNAKP